MEITGERRILVLYFLLLVLLTKPTVSVNDASRFATTQSLVETKSFRIDDSQFAWTIDKYFYRGHYYSDKPPALAIYAAGFYWLLHSSGVSFGAWPLLSCYLLTLLVVGLVTCLGLLYFARVLRLFGVERRWASVVLLMVGAGTLLLPYSTAFNNHTVSASLLITSFYHLLNSHGKALSPFVSGTLVALAGSVDIGTFLFGPAYAFCLLRRPLKSLLAFLVGFGAVFIIYVSLNYHLSGSVYPPASNPALWAYPGSSFNPDNLTGLAHHSDLRSLLNYAANMLVGHRGLLCFTPILMFSIVGFGITFRRLDRYHLEYSAVVFASVLYVLIYVLRSNNYSGWAYGVRWYADVMFFLCLPLAFVGDEIRTSRYNAGLFMATGTLSVLLSFVGVIEPFAPDPPHLNSLVSVLTVAFDITSASGSPLMSLAKAARFAFIGLAALLACRVFLRSYRQYVDSFQSSGFRPASEGKS